ncbi:Uncharacterised protein [Nocardia otitidiscaviarum]|uniref:Uncharacterized protein n=1 Tax=Nocardia otitidiscaviarum TaxID=1823 RepID=A0A378YQ72_9NOCA|nr:hypothetical protein [Nocardia otitidiscaviarum]SUA79264.1 Uncharacterised protein [Nocardia otitidiscaviarum]
MSLATVAEFRTCRAALRCRDGSLAATSLAATALVGRPGPVHRQL